MCQSFSFFRCIRNHHFSTIFICRSILICIICLHWEMEKVRFANEKKTGNNNNNLISGHINRPERRFFLNSNIIIVWHFFFIVSIINNWTVNSMIQDVFLSSRLKSSSLNAFQHCSHAFFSVYLFLFSHRFGSYNWTLIKRVGKKKITPIHHRILPIRNGIIFLKIF